MSVSQGKPKCFKCGGIDYYFKISCSEGVADYAKGYCPAVYHEKCLTLMPTSSLATGICNENAINCYWLCNSCNRYRARYAFPSFLMHQQQMLDLEKLNTNIVQGFERVNNNLEKGFTDLGNKMHCDMDQLRNDVSQELKQLSADFKKLNSGI